MKKKILTGIFAIILLIILILICMFFKYKNNIISVYQAMVYDSAKIEQKTEEENKKLKQATEEYIGENIRDYTNEEKEQIKTGEITEIQALATVVSEKVQTNNTPKKDANSYVSEAMNSLSSLEGVYVSSIESILSQAIDEFRALPLKQRTTASKAGIMGRYSNNIDVMEAECDAKVDKICSDLAANLKSINADTSIVKTIKDSYEAEKKLKKTYYINKYK